MRMTIFTVIFAAVSVFAAVPQGVDLASMSNWDIVVAADAVASEAYAAKEFQTHFELSSGVKLPIVKAVNRPDRHVFIGPGKLMRCNANGFDIDEFGPEDLRIIVRNNNIVIAGGRPRGTLYGVYTFLEDYLGIRFLTAEHIHVPDIGKWRLIGPLDRFYHPPFMYRKMWRGEIEKYPAFATRLRVNADITDPNLGGAPKFENINHTFFRQVPMKKYAREHPEYYSLVGGKRKILFEKRGFAFMQLCLTNPDVLRIVTDAVLAQLKADPNKPNISVSQNDGGHYCHCPNCAAIDSREGSQAGSLLAFVNKVADEVAKQYPDVLVGTLAYGYTRKPPETIKPRPNVQIQLCSSGCCQIHPIDDPNCSINVEFCRNMAKWGNICKNISIWNYNANYSAYLLPWPNLHVIGPNVKYFAANNTKAIFMQTPSGLGSNFSDLRNYITAKMIWDPSQSGQQLMDEFLRLHYGKAEPAIRRYLDLIRHKVDSGGYHINHSFKYCRDYGIDEATVKAGIEIFDEALKLAENETVRARVEKASVCAWRAAIEPVWRMQKKEQLVGLDPALIERMKPIARKLKELTDKYGVNRVTSRDTVNPYHKRMKRLLDL